MSVTKTNTFSGPYFGTGSRTEFPFNFACQTGDIIATIDGNEESGFSVRTTLNGGYITFNVAPANGTEVIIKRRSPLTQLSTYKTNQPFYPEDIESALDKLTLICQELKYKLDSFPDLGEEGTETLMELYAALVRYVNAAKTSSAEARAAYESLMQVVEDLKICRAPGEIFSSMLPLDGVLSGIHKLDGGTIALNGVYKDFVDYLKSLKTSSPGLFCTEATWQAYKSTYGSVGMFVVKEATGSSQWYNSAGNAVYAETQEPTSSTMMYQDRACSTAVGTGTISKVSGVAANGKVWFRYSTGDGTATVEHPSYFGRAFVGGRPDYFVWAKKRNDELAVGDTIYSNGTCTTALGTVDFILRNGFNALQVSDSTGEVPTLTEYFCDPSLDSGEYYGYRLGDCASVPSSPRIIYAKSSGFTVYSDTLGTVNNLLLIHVRDYYPAATYGSFLFRINGYQYFWGLSTSNNTWTESIPYYAWRRSLGQQYSGAVATPDIRYTGAASIGIGETLYADTGLSSAREVVDETGSYVQTVTLSSVAYYRYEEGFQQESAGYVRLPLLTGLISGISSAADLARYKEIPSGSGDYALRELWYIQLTNSVKFQIRSDASKLVADLEGKADADLGNVSNAGKAGLVPAGTVMAFAGSVTPTGYLACNGAAVSRKTYKDLFNAIGTTYGSGNGSTTFNLPNFQGCFLRGTGGNAEALGTRQSEGLPEITGKMTNVLNYAEGATASGALSKSNTGTVDDNGSGTTFAYSAYAFKASKSSGVYGASSHVTPVNFAVNYIIKF